MVFNILVEKYIIYNTENIRIYRNALIQELSNTFKYTDYEKFKQRVIDSLDSEEMIVVESDHLKALGLLKNDEKELEEVIEHLKSNEFREKLIVDYLNVLNDLKEFLEIRKLKLVQSLPELTEKSEQLLSHFSLLSDLNANFNGLYEGECKPLLDPYTKSRIGAKKINEYISEYERINDMIVKNRFNKINLNELIASEMSEGLVNLIESEQNYEYQIYDFFNLTQRLNKYLEIVAEKSKIGRELLDFIEKWINPCSKIAIS
jgi:hypothetical protein